MLYRGLKVPDRRTLQEPCRADMLPWNASHSRKSPKVQHIAHLVLMQPPRLYTPGKADIGQFIAALHTALIPRFPTPYSQHCLKFTTGHLQSGTGSFLHLQVCQMCRQLLAITLKAWEKRKPHVNAGHLNRLARHEYAPVRPSQNFLQESAVMSFTGPS